MMHINRGIAILLIISCSLLAACTPKTTPQSKIQPSILETVEGSSFKRVVLTQKAAERIGIQTVQISEENVERTRSIGSEVVSFPQAEASVANQVWVRVSLSENDLTKVDRSRPANVSLLDDVEDSDEFEGFSAELDEGLQVDDPEEMTEVLYYKLSSTEHNLTLGQRVMVELPLTGSGALQKIIPYAAVIYGLKGEAWVYTNPEPLVFIRQPIVIDYIEGDEVILSEGPDTGTAIVIVGGAELFGAETGVSK